MKAVIFVSVFSFCLGFSPRGQQVKYQIPIVAKKVDTVTVKQIEDTIQAKIDSGAAIIAAANRDLKTLFLKYKNKRP